MIGQATKKAIIEVQLDDKASGGLKKLQTNTDSVSSKMKAGFNKIAVAVAATTAAIGGATAAIMSMASRAGKIESLSLGFERNFGDMEKALESFRKASAGMVSDFDLMQTANRAALLGVTTDVDKLSGLMVTARLRGREMGMDMTQAFSDIVTGIGRASPMILDNLGIVIDAEGKYQAYAEAVGKTAEELTKAEKTQALLNGVLESSKGLLEETGGLTLDNAGKWEQMSAAQKNYFDLVKSDIADATSWWAEYWAAVFNKQANLKEARDLWEQVQKLGLITPELQAAYDAAVRGGQQDVTFLLENIDALKTLVENYEKATQAAAEGTDKWAAANYEGAEAALLATGAIRENNIELERMAKIQEEISKVTSLTGYFSDMVSLGENFTDILAEITKQEQIMAENPIGSEKYEEAKGKVEELKVAMQDLANQVVLDMMMSTIAIGGVTQAEADAYFQLAADMGTISQEAAEEAKAAYGNAIEYINSLEIDDKTGNIVFKVDDTEVRNYVPPRKTGTVYYGGAWETPYAVGGAVQGGAPYTWQEYGYRGELFVPSADGFIMSRADAERALSKALAGGASKESINADDIGRAIANALMRAGVNKSGNVYNLTMPTSSNPADVKTAFELMEAWA